MTFDAKHEGGHYFKVKYDWFNAQAATADGQIIETTQNDSGFLKDWTLVQIEGEEPVEAVVEDPMTGTTQAPPPAELTRATYAWRDALVDVLRTHQAAPGSGEATLQQDVSVNARACMGSLLRRVLGAIRDGRTGGQGGVISLTQALRGRLQQAELNTDTDRR